MQQVDMKVASFITSQYDSVAIQGGRNIAQFHANSADKYLREYSFSQIVNEARALKH